MLDIDQMRVVAETLDQLLERVNGEQLGFVLLVFPYGEASADIMEAISSVGAEDVIDELRQMADRLEAQPRGLDDETH